MHCKARRNHMVPCFSTAERASACRDPGHHHQRGGLPLGSAGGAHCVASGNRVAFGHHGSTSRSIVPTVQDNVFLCQPRPLAIGMTITLAGPPSLSFYSFSFTFPVPRGGGHSPLLIILYFLEFFFALFSWLDIVLNWTYVSGQHSYVEALTFRVAVVRVNWVSLMVQW